MTSSKCFPVIIIPTGSPSENPALRVKDGCPVELNGPVFLTIPNALCIFAGTNENRKLLSLLKKKINLLSFIIIIIICLYFTRITY